MLNTTRWTQFLGPLLASFALALSACQKDDITVALVAKGPSAETASPHAPEEPPLGAPDEHAGHDHGADGVAWEAPASWKEQPAGGMRAASFLASNKNGEADVSVVVLSGDAGGDLANVNRWRGQVGLDPIDETALAAQSRKVKTKAGEVLLVDITGTGSPKRRLMAGILKGSGRTWFFKMTGEDGAVAAAKNSFLSFLGSLRNASH